MGCTNFWVGCTNFGVGCTNFWVSCTNFWVDCTNFSSLLLRSLLATWVNFYKVGLTQSCRPYLLVLLFTIFMKILPADFCKDEHSWIKLKCICLNCWNQKFCTQDFLFEKVTEWKVASYPNFFVLFGWGLILSVFFFKGWVKFPDFCCSTAEHLPLTSQPWEWHQAI